MMMTQRYIYVTNLVIKVKNN